MLNKLDLPVDQNDGVFKFCMTFDESSENRGKKTELKFANSTQILQTLIPFSFVSQSFAPHSEVSLI